MQEERISPTQISIIRPTPDDWQVLRDLKLRSLDHEPVAFADPEPERQKYGARTEGQWRAILEGRRSDGSPGETLTFFAQDSGEYAGMVSAIVPASEERVATIQHVYVNPAHRGRHIGEQLLTQLLSELQTRGDVSAAELDVVVTQEAAIGLYKKLGFQVTNVVRGEAHRGDQTYDEYSMRLDFNHENQ